jgi:hypothetical protein
VDDVNGANIKPYFVTANANECIKACSENSECKRAIWTTVSDPIKSVYCWLRRWNGVAKVPTKTGSWSSANIQE